MVICCPLLPHKRTFGTQLIESWSPSSFSRGYLLYTFRKCHCCVLILTGVYPGFRCTKNATPASDRSPIFLSSPPNCGIAVNNIQRSNAVIRHPALSSFCSLLLSCIFREINRYPVKLLWLLLMILMSCIGPVRSLKVHHSKQKAAKWTVNLTY